MTFLEKYREDHPDVTLELDIVGELGCPFTYGYEENKIPNCHIASCFDCWNRAIPKNNIDSSKYRVHIIDIFLKNNSIELEIFINDFIKDKEVINITQIPNSKILILYKELNA